jgi:hypothetical protein
MTQDNIERTSIDLCRGGSVAFCRLQHVFNVSQLLVAGKLALLGITGKILN